MKKLLATSVTAGLFLFSFSAQAGEFGELQAKIGAVRSSMIEMLTHKEKRGPEQMKAADEKSAGAKAAIAALKAPAGKEAKFEELKEILKAFLDTRDNELRAAILDNNDGEAKRLLTVVQKERFAKMTALTDELNK